MIRHLVHSCHKSCHLRLQFFVPIESERSGWQKREFGMSGDRAITSELLFCFGRSDHYGLG